MRDGAGLRGCGFAGMGAGPTDGLPSSSGATPFCIRHRFWNPKGLVTEAPVFSKLPQLPTLIGQVCERGADTRLTRVLCAA